MDITLRPGKLSGTVTAPPSKSMAHRMLICSAFSDKPTNILCAETSDDIEATVDCLVALGAMIQRHEHGYYVKPVSHVPAQAFLNCRESGSTLRFLLPIVGALGIKATLKMEGRLPHRPLSPLWEEMERMGCRLSRPSEDTILCEGKLTKGTYAMDGSVSSQFISGLLMALPLIGGTLDITGTPQSKPYIDMTLEALSMFQDGTPGQVTVEGDWSNAAFWLAANALGSDVKVIGLNENTVQGDRAITCALSQLKQNVTLSAADIPDLIPILSVVAATNKGAVFTDIGRLRHKESDRVEAIIGMLTFLGGKATATDNTLTVYGTGLLGGVVNSFSDHRIAMSAAIAATVCTEPVTIIGAECVKKSYPKFWAEFARLGGNYEKQLW